MKRTPCSYSMTQLPFSCELIVLQRVKKLTFFVEKKFWFKSFHYSSVYLSHVLFSEVVTSIQKPANLHELGGNTINRCTHFWDSTVQTIVSSVILSSLEKILISVVVHRFYATDFFFNSDQQKSGIIFLSRNPLWP